MIWVKSKKRNSISRKREKCSDTIKIRAPVRRQASINKKILNFLIGSSSPFYFITIQKSHLSLRMEKKALVTPFSSDHLLLLIFHKEDSLLFVDLLWWHS